MDNHSRLRMIQMLSGDSSDTRFFSELVHTLLINGDMSKEEMLKAIECQFTEAKLTVLEQQAEQYYVDKHNAEVMRKRQQ